MTISGIPVASAMAWLLAFAFAGAGLFNAIGGAAGPLFASWAHRHLGVESVYRLSALFVFAIYVVLLAGVALFARELFV